MNFQPQSEGGKRLFSFLANWIKKSPEFAVDKIKRIFLTFSVDLKNRDGFVAALYGQNVLDESPPVLVHGKILISVWNSVAKLIMNMF